MTDIAKKIDSTLLKPTATAEQIDALCKEAAKYKFYSVCVNPAWVAFARESLDSYGAKDVMVCSVIDFPFGNGGAGAKVQQARQAIKDGARELDVVFNVGKYHSGSDGVIEAFGEIEDFQNAVDANDNVKTKVIIETCYLTDAEISEVSAHLVKIGVDFVKTSTGYGTRGASVKDIELMTAAVNGKASVKASGGIGTYEDAKAMIDAGADRIGTSHAAEIVDGQN